MQSTFFTDFLYLTDIKTILFIVVLFALFFVMKQMEKKKVKFSTRMLSATGIRIGLRTFNSSSRGIPRCTT